MIGFIFACIFFIAGLVCLVISFTKVKEEKENIKKDKYYYGGFTPSQIFRLISALLVIGALLITAVSMFFKIEPDTIGVVYNADGSTKTVNTGYNIKAPWAIKKTWSSKAFIITFSEGENQDDIYGAQTSEKDYISVVATLSIRIDVNRLNDYIVRYGDKKIDDDAIIKLLKSTSRTAIENVISSCTTADVMSNKSKVNADAFEEFRTVIADQPIIIDSFTIDDLVAPESYEQAIVAQAALRMEKQQAELQKEVNEANALANKIKAEGEAQVAEVNATKEAAVAKIKAENDAEVKKINADNEAEIKKISAEAEANQIKIKSEAEAQATVLAGEAEAKAKTALSDIYKNNPELYELAVKEIEAEVQKEWAEKWSGYDFNGMSSFSFADVSDLLSGILSKETN